MANKKETTKKDRLIVTKQRLDNSIEVEVTKNPAKSKFVKVMVWIIAACTLLIPVAGLLYLLILAAQG